MPRFRQLTKGVNTVKKLTYVCLLVAFVVAISTRATMGETPEAPKDAQKIVVHLSHFTDDLHRCFMAVKLGTLMQKSGAQVTLFLDLEGVRLAERRQDLDMTWGSNPTTLAKHYEDFTGAGGKVLLCPHCAHSAHIGDMSLKRNAEIASEQVLGKMLLDADKILDY
jgi:predicted peroxiredoxin